MLALARDPPQMASPPAPFRSREGVAVSNRTYKPNSVVRLAANRRPFL